MTVLTVDTAYYFGHILSRIRHGDTDCKNKMFALVSFVYTAGDTKSCQLHICICVLERFGNLL